MQQKLKASTIMLKLTSILLILPILFATVASVPTSVLVQNSELSASNNDIASLNNLKLKNNGINKVKRSSNEANGISSASTVSNHPTNNDLEKKSSPEVVPAPFNSPPQRPFLENAVLYGPPDNSLALNTDNSEGLTHERAIQGNDLEKTHIFEDEPTISMYKRGISYGNDDGLYSNPFLNPSLAATQYRASNSDGVWADELDPVSSYNDDLQELDDYTPVQSAPSYRRKAYDNLQNLLNTNTYLEPATVPYSGPYYGMVDADRIKRSNPSKLNRYSELRSPKRNSKLTPADMLALVALVEAGERARKDVEPEINEPNYPADGISFRNSFANNPDIIETPLFKIGHNKEDDDGGIDSSYQSTGVIDFYGNPLKVTTYPKYDIETPHDQYKYNGRYPLLVKRFMVAKKSRPYGKFLNGPVSKSSISYLNNPIDENYY